MKTLTAMLIAPIVAGSGCSLASEFGSERMFGDITEMIEAFVASYFYSLVLTAAVALPLRYVWKRLDFMRGWVATAIGAGLGVAVAIATGLSTAHFEADSSQPIEFVGYPIAISMWGLAGAAAGLCLLGDRALRDPSNATLGAQP